MEQLLYKYIKIDIERFTLFEDDFPPKLEDVHFQISAQFDYNKEQYILCSKLTVTLSAGEKSILETVICSYFSIKEESVEQIINEKGRLIFAPPTLVQFASLNYGSLRGVIYVKTKGSQLENYILPPIFFGQIIDKSFEVD
jgi:hypothetical protein